MKGWILACTLLGACGGSDAEVAGNYTVALTNGDNGCNLPNFTPGQMTSGVGIVITQDGSKVTVVVKDLGGVALKGLLGATGDTFAGSVNGDDFDVDSTGTKANTMGNCTFTYNAHIDGTLDGDVIRGRIEYRAADNGNSDCTSMNIHGCVTFQDYNGTRPPQ